MTNDYMTDFNVKNLWFIDYIYIDVSVHYVVISSQNCFAYFYQNQAF